MRPVEVCAFACAFVNVSLRAAAQRRRSRRRRFRFVQRLLAHRFKEADVPAVYNRVNASVPILRLWTNVELELMQDFRVSRATMRGVLRLLRRELDHGWGNEMELLIYTYWLAHGLSTRAVSAVFNVPRATVHHIVHRVAQNIQRRLSAVVSFPPAQQLTALGQGFVSLSGTPAFANVVGAIHRSRFVIKPPQIHRLDYLDPQGGYSISMQAICDAQGRFLDVLVGYPGSVPPATVMRNSPFYRTQRFPPPGHILLGDGGYPCLQTPVCVITPFEDPLEGPTQRQFNAHHGRAHRSVHRALDMMKTRWRSTLRRAVGVKTTFAPQVIASCAFLHNVCIDNGDVMEPEEDVAGDGADPHPPCDPPTHGETSGNATRDSLAAMVSHRAGGGASPHSPAL